MTQTQQIKSHLMRHNSITPMEALRKFGCYRLAARIGELREAGMSITTAICSRRGKRYAKYVAG